MSDIQQRKDRWNRLYEGRQKTICLVRRTGAADRPWPYPEYTAARVAWALADYRWRMDALAWLDDDAVPYLDPFTGTEIFAEAFGCTVHRSGDNMPFALPLINDARQLRTLKKPRLEDSSLMAIFDIADSLKRAEPDALMRLPDVQSPFDIAALIWEKSDFFAALMEEPAVVRELVAMTTALLTEFLDEWFRRYGTEFAAHFPDYYMPYGITLSEDECGCLSADTFREFCLDSLNGLAGRYGRIGIHCCANSRHQWDNFQSIRNLTLMNISHTDEAVRAEAYTFFKDTCAQMHPTIPYERIDTDARVVLKIAAAGRDDAVEKCRMLREIAQRWQA